MKFKVYNRWDLEIEQLRYESSYGDKQSFMQRIAANLGMVSSTVGAAVTVLEKASWRWNCVDFTVMDMYAGAGFLTLACQELFKPTRHVAVEIDPYCVEHLRRAFPSVEVIQGRVEDNLDQSADLFVLDWNGFTVSSFLNRLPMMHDIIGLKPRGILIWDTARSYFWVNRAKYENIFGVPLTNMEDYSRQLSEMFWSRLGYSITLAAAAKNSSYYMLEPFHANPMWLPTPTVEAVQVQEVSFDP